jgi:hypothetical protein
LDGKTEGKRRGRVCRLQFLMTLASAVIFECESLRSRDYILLSQIPDPPFRLLLRLAGLWWKYSTPPPHGIFCLFCQSQSHSYFTIGGLPKSVRLGLESLETHGQNYFSQLNICDHSPYITSSLTRGWFCNLQLLLTLASVFILGSEYPGTLRPCFTISDSKLPFLSPPTTLRATVEVFDPASTQEWVLISPHSFGRTE